MAKLIRRKPRRIMLRRRWRLLEDEEVIEATDEWAFVDRGNAGAEVLSWNRAEPDKGITVREARDGWHMLLLYRRRY